MAEKKTALGGVTSPWGTQDYVVDVQTGLVFDSTPTQNSLNPVTSGGIYTAIRSRDAVGDSIFSTVTEIPSNGLTITPTADWSGYSYLAITFNTASSNPASSRLAALVPIILLPYTNWYPIAMDGVSGAVQVGRVSNSTQLTLKSDVSPLYVANVRRIK